MKSRGQFIPILCSIWMEVLGIVDANIQCYACESATNNTCTEFWDLELEIANSYLSDCRTGKCNDIFVSGRCCDVRPKLCLLSIASCLTDFCV